MGRWHQTGCVLCAQNCGLQILVEDNKMVRVKPDKSNLRSEGYVCRKGLNIMYHQYPKDRLKTPLKRVGDTFEPISWEQATDEIAGKLKKLLDDHGPRCLAYMGASAQGGHFEGAFGVTFLKSLGSQYLYSSAGQEFSGMWWIFGRTTGKQYNVMIPDEHESEMIVGWGWNGMMSHQMPQARKVLTAFSKDKDRLLVVVDPRKSETAAIADIHLPVRPGTDALLMKAMIAIILENGWENRDYLNQYVDGWEKIEGWFKGFDATSAISLCELDYETVKKVCRLLTTKTWCMHPDLGIYMGRHSTLNCYFLAILGTVCGIFGVRGGNVIPGMVMPMGFHADERDPRIWRTVQTGMPPAAAGSFPPNVMPEEILSDHKDRLRAVFVSACNPMRAYADTTAYEKAFKKLDLLVVNEIVMSETARFAHYVLPCRSYYESWDGTFFPWTFPDVFFQMRRPVVRPEEDFLESAQIFTRIADKMGLIPPLPADLEKAAEGDRMAFGAKLMAWAATNEKAFPQMPFVLAKTLGKVWDSANLAALWGMLMVSPKTFRDNAKRSGFASGMDQGDRIFQAILDNPQGLIVGKADTENLMAAIRTPSGKIEIHIPELADQGKSLDAITEEADLNLSKEYPLILNAGRHMDFNSNTLMRNPEWNKGKRACTIAINPEDARTMNFTDGQQVRVVTEAGSETGELEVSKMIRKGTVLIPHGFGLIYDGSVYGVNVNRLTKNTHRDFLGTPVHRFVPCRLENH